MDKFIVDKNSDADEYEGGEKRLHVRFPVCLAVKYGTEVPFECADFVMNISRGGVFIETTSPLPRGSMIVMHLYIPPHEKLLGEFRGTVVGVNVSDPTYPRGMHVRFEGASGDDLKRLMEFLEEKRHLLDRKA